MSNPPQSQVMVALITIVALVAGIAIGGLYFGTLGEHHIVVSNQTLLPSTSPPSTSTVIISNTSITSATTTSTHIEVKESVIPGLSTSWEQIEQLASLVSSGGKASTIAYLTRTVATVIPTATQVAAPESTQITIIKQQIEELSSRLSSITLQSGEKIYYSGTNVQVSGVDEPDIVKTNGTHVFVARGKFIEIYKAYPAKQLSLIKTIDVSKIVDELAGKEYLALVSGNQTTIISTVKRDVSVRGLFVENKKLVIVLSEARWPGPLEPRTWIIMLNDKGGIAHYAATTGYFYDARLTNKTLVLVTSMGNIVRPLVVLGPSRIIAPPPVLVGTPTVQTIVTSISLLNWNASTVSFVGASPSSLYMTASGDIYVVLPGSAKLLRSISSLGPEEAAKKLKDLVMRRYYENSTILHLRVTKNAQLELVAEGTVPGRIWKQWMLDVYNGTLRIVTESWEGGLHVSLYILDAETLKPIGMLKDIALNERVHAVRFLGTTLYLVTFRNIDPLFAIDLSNPAQPKVIGYVKSPGFDEYLHPLSNDLLVGVGREDQWVRLTLYRIEKDRSVTIVSRIYLKGYTWSPVLNSRTGHRAFTLDPIHSYILLPVRTWSCYGVQEGVAVIKFNTKKPDISLIKVLSHRFSDRTLFIDDIIYSVSINNPVARIKAFDAKTLKEIAVAPKPLSAKIAQILENPDKYLDKAVILHGKSLLWKGLDYAPPVSRSDWVLDDGTGRIYVAAYSPYKCHGTTVPFEEAEVEVIGVVKMGWNKHPYILPVEVKIIKK